MKEVLIDGEIGYDWWSDSGVTGKDVTKALEGLAPGEEVRVTINSPGGSVYEGAVIFNLLRETAKTHPVSVSINTIAMSMASYIALAARTVDKSAKVSVSDNAVIMIHNPWGYTIGDYRDFKKEGEFLEKLAAMIGLVYAAATGKSEDEIRAAMDDESFYVGKEIFDAGFANDYEAMTPDTKADDSVAFGAGRDGKIIGAKMRFDKAMQIAREAHNKKEHKNDLIKAAALFRQTENTKNQTDKKMDSASGASLKNTIGGKMKAEELLAQDKSCYDEVYAKGAAEALEKERSRVAAHIKMGEKVGSLKAACKFIEEGKAVSDDAVQAEYFTLSVDKNRYDARLADNQSGLDFRGESGGNDNDKIAAAFMAGLHGKSLGGQQHDE